MFSLFISQIFVKFMPIQEGGQVTKVIIKQDSGLTAAVAG
jgi:hypothetical protein